MPHVLQQLLKRDDSLFLTALDKLERAVGNEGVDTRLIADITHKAHEIIRSLQLTPAHTTGIEAYSVLRSHVAKQDRVKALLSTDYVLFSFDGEIVSFNLIDILDDIQQNKTYKDRTLEHARRALMGEIVHRYTTHTRTHDPTVRELLKDSHLLTEDSAKRKKTLPPITQLQSIKQEDTMSQPYILAVGDIFTDAFIQLDEQYAKVTTDEDGNEWLSLPYGQKPPYEQVDIVKSVGPSPNAAVSFARLGGVKSGLMAWLGDDTAGEESLAHLKTENVDTAEMISQEGSASSYWYVLRYKADRTMLVKSEKYAYHWSAPSETPDWIYLSYIGEDSWPLHEELLAYLAEHPEVKLAFQPGSFHFEWGTEKLAAIYKRSHIVVMNREEAAQVTGRSHESIADLADGLHALGPHKVVITDGSHGSYASYDFKLVTIPNYPDPAPPTDRTGAGDAFASTIVAALALGESMDTALTWAPINSASVVQKLGAQAGLLSREDVEKFLHEAPDWYKLTDFEG